MAQIEQSDKGGKKKKGAQKKMAIHVDFTPMVDMNMLLITFFMLCTTMIKSQTLQIILPAKTDPGKKQEKTTQAKADRVMTLILDTQYDANGKPLTDENGNTVHDIYYYEMDPMTGQVDSINANTGDDRKFPYAVAHQSYIGNQNGVVQGVRSILRKKNLKVMEKYDELKAKYANKEISDEEFKTLATENAKDTLKTPAIVIIKAGPNATYENVISAFDELSLNQIRSYSFEHPNASDTALLRNYEKANGKTVIRENVRRGK